MGGERNYHSFYYLLAAAQAGELHSALSTDPTEAPLTSQWGVGKQRSYAYLRDFDSTLVAQDVSNFTNFCRGLNAVHIEVTWQRHLFRLLAGLLELGNLCFEPFEDHEKGFEGCRIVAGNDGVSNVDVAARLLQVSPRMLTTTLTQRRMQMSSKSSIYSIPLRVSDARDARDGLASSLYAGLFAWVVAQINVAAAGENVSTEHAASPNVNDGGMHAGTGPPLTEPTVMRRVRHGHQTLIGILDVFGFVSSRFDRRTHWVPTLSSMHD